VNDDGYSDGTAADILKYLVRLIKQFYPARYPPPEQAVNDDGYSDGTAVDILKY
jgi:hypothetical protein